jgi:hypothetical protein
MSVATIFLAPIDARIKFYGDADTAVTELIREDRYQKIGSIATDKTGEAAAEEMFDLSNNPSRQDERDEKWGRYPSLSVGDVVHVDNESFLCMSMGWKKL